jgi:hypothetical protein
MAIEPMKFVLLLWVLLGSIEVIGQKDSIPPGKVLSPNEEAIVRWVGTIYEHGIRVDGDTLVMSVEVQQIIGNDSLRAILFPDVYTWEHALSLMQVMELKKAFWILINLYPQHKELVMKTILAYDELFEMDRALLSTFYTFSMIDPQVCDFIDGRPVIKRPDVVEAKLASVKEMVGYVLSYRAQEKKN